MNWKNLKDMKCPSCSGELWHVVPRGIECKTCPFLISHPKFEEIVASLYKPKGRTYRPQGDNLGDLNNLDQKGITEDFSDSRHLDY